MDQKSSLRSKFLGRFNPTSSMDQQNMRRAHRASADFTNVPNSRFSTDSPNARSNGHSRPPPIPEKPAAQRAFDEMDKSCNYLVAIVNSAQVQQLAGATNDILNAVFKLCTALEHDTLSQQQQQRAALLRNTGAGFDRRSPLMRQLYSHVVDLLKWTDRLVMACVLSAVEQERSPTPSTTTQSGHSHIHSAEPVHDLRTAMPTSKLPQYLKEVTQLTVDLRSTCYALVSGKTQDLPASPMTPTSPDVFPPSPSQQQQQQAQNNEKLVRTPSADMQIVPTSNNQLQPFRGRSGSEKHEDWVESGYTGPVALNETHHEEQSAKDALERRTEEEQRQTNKDGSIVVRKHTSSEQKEVSTHKSSTTSSSFKPSFKMDRKKDPFKQMDDMNADETCQEQTQTQDERHSFEEEKKMFQQRFANSRQQAMRKMSDQQTIASTSLREMLRADSTNMNDLLSQAMSESVVARQNTRQRPPVPPKMSAFSSSADGGMPRLKMNGKSDANNENDNQNDSEAGAWQEHVSADGSRVLVRKKDDIKALRERGGVDAHCREARKDDGQLLARQTTVEKAMERAALALTQKTSSEGNGHGMERSGAILAEKLNTSEEQREGVNQPPPLPPRKTHVAIHIDLMANSADGGARSRRAGSMHKQDSMEHTQQPWSDLTPSDNMRATLASYLMLRDNLIHYEQEQLPQRPGAIASSYSTSDIHSNALPITGSGHDYTNLSTILTFTEDDTLRLPLKYTADQPTEQEQQSIGWHNRLAIEDVSVLQLYDVREYLVMRATMRQLGEVQGGPRDALIAHATQSDATQMLYQEAFITTYRTFVNVNDVLAALVRRYDHFQAATFHTTIQQDGHECTNTQRRSVVLTTFSLITRIVDDISLCELSTELMTTVTHFIYCLLMDGEVNHARALRERFSEKLQMHMKYHDGAPAPPLLPHLHSRQPSHIDAVLEMKSRAIAEQMTYIDSYMFHKINLCELLRWSEAQDVRYCANLVAYREHWNAVSSWVCTRVLRPADRRDRERNYMKLVKVAKHLRDMGNFNGVFSIVSSLESSPVRRLQWPGEIQSAMVECARIIDPGHGFRNYRNALALSRPPLLPYLGLILQDLTFTHAGNPANLDDKLTGGRKNLINFGKRWRQFAILDAVRKVKNWQYTYERNDRIQQLLNFDDHYTEEEWWARSEAIKPRESR